MGAGVLQSVVSRHFKSIESSYANLLGWEQDISRKAIISELYAIADSTMSLNNVGDAWNELTSERIHTKFFEKSLIEFFAEKYASPGTGIWGCVTPGGTLSNLQALLNGRNQLNDPVGLYSEMAHHSVKKAFDAIHVPSIPIRADNHGRMDMDYFESVLSQTSQDILVNATIGTTLLGSSDDIMQIKSLLDNRRHYIHGDAAFFGGYLPFMDHRVDGLHLDCIDSISISGHKFYGLPNPASLLLINRCRQSMFGDRLCMTSNIHDTTIVGSRDGHAPLIWWYIINRVGEDGFRKEVEQAFRIKDILVDALTDMGVAIFPNESYSLLLPIAQPKKPNTMVLKQHGSPS